MSVVAPGTRPKSHKPRWHFGIRSRSPPMEVMLEIYRTLQSLGMEWRKKSPPPDTNIVDEKGRKDHSVEEKYAQGLFFVETRCRVRDVVVSASSGWSSPPSIAWLTRSASLPSPSSLQVRMDLQLYKVDAQNMLVDFRNVGYYRTIPGQPGYARLKVPSVDTSPLSVPSPASIRRSLDMQPASGLPSLEDVVMRGGSQASSFVSTPATAASPPDKCKPKSDVEVTSPFLFLDCACRLIVELAGG
jgi:carbon catabolite-derepressing protein kinase